MSARIEVHQEVFLKIRKRLNKINNMTYVFEESRFNTCLCFCVHCQFPLCSSSEFRDSYWEDSGALVKGVCLSLLASYGMVI